jgi:hypothetical protein
MNYGEIIGRAWALTWRTKRLWLLGLLVTIGVGGNTAGGTSPTGANPGGAEPIRAFSADQLVLLLGIVGVLMVLAITLWVVSVIARGALIAAVNRLERDGVCTLGQAWADGVHNFGRLFIIGLITAIPGLLTAFFTLMAAIPALTGAGVGGALSATVYACFVPLCCTLALAGLVLGAIQLFVDRAAVVEDLSVGAAFSRGWQMLRANISDLFLLFVLWAIISWVFHFLSLPVGVLAIPAVFQVVSGGGAAAGGLLLAALGLVVAIVAVLAFSVFNFFASAMWTLAYRKLVAPG